MLRLIIFLPLAAVLKQSLGWGEEDIGITYDVSEMLQKEIVDTHNDIRRGVVPTASNMLKMGWSTEASQSAKSWARKCHARIGPEAERTVDGIVCGANLMQSNYAASWSDVIELWQSRVSNFKYGLGSIDIRKDIYTYTELIWYKTNLVGCAVAYCLGKTFQYLYVCYYCPAGNLIEQAQRPYKEGPPCEDCPFHCEDHLCTNPCKYTDNKRYCGRVSNLHLCSIKLLEQECQATCLCRTEIV